MSLARSVGRNAIWNAAGRVAVLLVWFAATPQILAALGAERFGFWSILLALGVSLAAFDLGLGVAVTRDVAGLAAADDAAGIRRLVGGAVLVQAGLGAAFLLLGLLVREPILGALHVPAAWRPEARQAFVYALAGYGLLATGNVLLATLQGLQRMDVAARITLPAAGLLFLALLFAARAREPLVVLTIVQVGHGLLVLLALLAASARLLRGAGRPAAAGRRAVSFRRLLSLGGWVQFSALLALVHGQVDKVILGTMVALAPVTSYELGARIGQAAVMLPVLALGALLPAAARVESSAGAGGRLPVYRAALAPYFLLAFGVVGALVGLAPALLEAWLGQAPPGAAWMLRALAVSYGGSLAGGIASTLVRSAGAMRIEATYAVVVTGLHVVLSWLGLLAWGVPGILAGNVAASLLGVLWFVHRVESWLGARPLVETARTAAPGLAAAAVGALAATAVAGLFAGLDPGQARGALALGVAGGAYGLVFVLVLVAAFPATWAMLVGRVRSILHSPAPPVARP